MTEPRKIWFEQCEAAEGIEDEFGTQKALEYLVDEKFLNFLEAAENDKEFRAEIPAFVAKIKEFFERWQLAAYLETAKETEPFDPSLFEPRDHPILGKVEKQRPFPFGCGTVRVGKSAEGSNIDANASELVGLIGKNDDGVDWHDLLKSLGNLC